MLQNTLLASALILALGVGTANAAPTGTLYIDDAVGNIGTVNLATGVVTVLGNSGVILTDIAFTANGSLYGTSLSSLYSLSKTTAAASLIGNYGTAGAGGMNALVGSGNGLYATSIATTALYSLTVAPFSVTTLAGSTSGNSAGDLAALSPTVLYETDINGNLVRLTIAAGTVASTVVGNTGHADIFGLARGDDGTTYAVAGTEIYTVNLSTAALTLLLNYAGHGLGFAFGTAFQSAATAVPEPMSLALLGIGMIGAGLVRRRRAG